MKSVWKNLAYFKPDENWGDPDRMDAELLVMLDIYRGYVGKPFTILCGFAQSGHKPRSWHYTGNAVDGRFSGGVTLLDAYIAADRVGFTGVGLYPQEGAWFIHLDNRPLSSGIKARWIRTDAGVYMPLDGDSFKKYVLPVV